MIGNVILLALAAFMATGPAAPSPSGDRDGEMDLSQARLMLDFLEAVSSGNGARTYLDSLMEAEGTHLIIAQMNLARRVSRDQYRHLLSGLMEGRKPVIQPQDSTRRALRGVQGLSRDVWPALEWGLSHTSELRKRLDHLRKLELSPLARDMANGFLPAPLKGSPAIFGVMGGRAGAAKLAGDQIYVDLLVYSFQRRRAGGFPDDQELIRTFAHELHHMGYGPYLRQWAQEVGLSRKEDLQVAFLSGILMEGSATYLISATRNLDRLREDRAYAGHLREPETLLDGIEAVLQEIQTGRIRNQDDLDEATAHMTGSWFHSAGSLLLGVIDEWGDLDAVERVMRDPRIVLAQFNRAVAALGTRAPARPVDPGLAQAVASMGNTP